jgi:hypothetical protein
MEQSSSQVGTDVNDPEPTSAVQDFRSAHCALPHFRSSRICCVRAGCEADKHRATAHSIIWSEIDISVAGTSSPSAFAILRLMKY